MFRCLVTAVLALAPGWCRGQDVALELVVPKSLLRDALPRDGEVLPFVVHENYYRHNRGKGAFFENAMFELAVGRSLRAA